MASELTIYSIYYSQMEKKYFLLRTERPCFTNSSQIQEDLANELEQNKRASILDLIWEKYEYQGKTNFEFIGEFQGSPIGDKLYLENGNFELEIFYLETEFGKPWIIIGNENSEVSFLKELNDDDDLLRLGPIGKPKQIKVTFVTENDFHLSEFKK